MGGGGVDCRTAYHKQKKNRKQGETKGKRDTNPTTSQVREHTHGLPEHIRNNTVSKMETIARTHTNAHTHT